MINNINHFALTALPTIYDEESMSTLQLVARVAAKINEVIAKVNEVDGKVTRLPFEVEKALTEEINSGNLADIIGPDVLNELGASLDELNERISRIVASSGQDNTEVVDMRTGHGATYPTAGDHVRALGDGSAFADAVRPGTVKHGRITAGMMGGDMATAHTLPSVCPMAGKWGVYAGYYNKSGVFVSHSGYSVSGEIPCAYGDTFLLKSFLFGPLVYPAAVFSASGLMLGVLGSPGVSSWAPIEDEVHIPYKQAAYVRFVCGVGYESQFRAVRVTANRYPDAAAAMGSNGYLHMKAKKRTDTVTDRAQIKVWFELPEGRSADDWLSVPLQLFKASNVSAWTFRVFAATSAQTYDQQLPESAAGYSFDPAQGMTPMFKVPLANTSGNTFTHACLFIDFLPAEGDEFMEAWLPLPRLNGAGEGIGYAMHGGLASDHLSVVSAGATGSALFGKRILGVGDSLMAGNNLPKNKTWFDIMAGRYDMEYHNAAINGQSVSDMASDIAATLAEFPNPDYFVLNGGANDLRLNVSVSAFREAVGAIITAVRAHNPQTKILALTNWQRSAYINPLGHAEHEYVEAMLEVCEAYSVKCLNNYADSLDLTNPQTQIWADEGMESTGTANLHFSAVANVYLVPRIAEALRSL